MHQSILLAIAALLSSAENAAAQDEPSHLIRFAVPVKTGQIIVHDLLWQCAGRYCAAVLSNSRPVIVCMAMARALGPVAGFETGGTALKEQELARCNTPRNAARIASAP